MLAKFEMHNISTKSMLVRGDLDDPKSATTVCSNILENTAYAKWEVIGLVLSPLLKVGTMFLLVEYASL